MRKSNRRSAVLRGIAGALCLLVWLASPALAWWVSRPYERRQARLAPEQRRFLRAQGCEGQRLDCCDQEPQRSPYTVLYGSPLVLLCHVPFVCIGRTQAAAANLASGATRATWPVLCPCPGEAFSRAVERFAEQHVSGLKS